MRILFCNYEYPPLGGGGGVVNAALAEQLAQRHEVTVLTSRAFDLPPRSIENGVQVIRVPVFFRKRRASANLASMFAYLPTAFWAGRGLLRRQRFDVINTHFVVPTGPVGYTLSGLSGVPNVLSVHGGDLYDPSKSLSPHRIPLLRIAVRHMVFAADAVVAQSSDTLSNLHRFFAPDAKAEIIPLGIPRPPRVDASRAKHDFTEDDILLITVGRLVARKAVDQLIDSLAALRDARVKLVVVGTGPLSETLMARADSRGVRSQVRFVGGADEQTKLELLSIADIFVSASQHEGFGLVFLEAMAAGLPVVCYDRGGQRDFLKDGETGFVVALNDHAGLTDRCRELIASSERRKAMGRYNKDRAERYFIDRCAEQYEILFESVIRRAPNAASQRRAI
jgi:glycosyltransferase involved in cell wall biosynthesis